VAKKRPVQGNLFTSAPQISRGPDPFVEQVADVCREHPRRAKWVIVARHDIGHTLGDRLALAGVDWVNLHVATPTDLATRMAAPALLARGVSPALEPLGPALVMRLLGDLRVDPPYFGSMADQPSMAAALWRTLRELRFSTLSPAHLPPAAFSTPAKHAELTGLLAAYEGWLRAHAAADLAGVFTAALEHLDFCPVQPADVVLEWPDADWDPLVRRLIDALPGERLRARTWRLPQRSRVDEHRERPIEELGPPVRTDAARLVLLADVASAPPPFGDGTLQIFYAGGRQAELDEVMRRVLACGRPLDEIEVVCLSAEDARRVWETCVRLGWRATVGAGLPVNVTRPGRGLLGWCDWVEGGFSSAAMRRMLQAGVFSPAWAAEDEGAERLTPPRAGRLLLEAGASWGRFTFGETLEAFAAQQEARSRTPGEPEGLVAWRQRRARHARALAHWIEGLLSAIPEGGDAGAAVPLGHVLRAARNLLEGDLHVAGDLDAAAHASLASVLDELGVLEDHDYPLAQALRLLRESLESIRLGRDRPRPGHLHISLVDDAGGSGRPEVFVIGLEQGRVAPAGPEDPVLLDAERTAINLANPAAARLRTSVERHGRSQTRVLRRMAQLGVQAERLTLSFSCRDTRDFRETHPAPLVLQAFRLLRGDAALSYSALTEWLGEPRSPVPRVADGAATLSQWWLAHASADGAREAVLATATGLAAGLAADAERDTDRFTSFDGLVSAAAAALDPTATGRSTSPTVLERLAHCPFAFFLREGLGVRPLEESEPDPDEWLDPMTRGRELHAIYAAITRRARAAGRRVSVEADLEWSLQLAGTYLARLRRELPPISELVAATESSELLDDVEVFVEAESAATGGEPIGFEVTFGREGTGEGETLDSLDPLVIELEGGRLLRIAGRIDRIDRAGSHRYEILDYKTGRFWPDEFTGVFAGGRRLQHVLYARAAEQRLRRDDPRAVVSRSVYWFPTSRGYGRRHVVEVAASHRIGELLGDLVQVIAAGAFVHQPDRKACDRCDLRAACGREPWTRAARKLGAPGNTELAAWLRVRGHE
jgi:ATP-dependent helicase/nuclease subunit B